MQYDQASHLFGIKEGKKLHRFTFDPATSTMTALPDLRVKGPATSYMLFDPEKANGMTAAVIGWDNDGANYETMTIYRSTGKPTRVHPFTGRSSRRRSMARSTSRKPARSACIAAGEKKPTTIKLPDRPCRGHERRLTHRLYDARRARGCRRNGRADLAPTAMGIEPADVLVGQHPPAPARCRRPRGLRRGQWCAHGSRVRLNFGLHDDALDASAAGATPMCEDPMLQ